MRYINTLTFTFIKKLADLWPVESNQSVCSMNAAGSFMPPALLFARKKMTEKLMIGAPADAIGIATDNGWMTG